jgi:hypothetical protein
MNREQQKRRSGVWISLAWWIAAGACFGALHPVRAEAQAASGIVPRVSLAELNGTPGSSLMVPLYFTPDPKDPIRSITVDIEFVSNNLKFDHASKGTAADESGAEITAAVTEGKPDAKNVTRSKLRVTTTIADPNNKKGLPDGLLAYLLFEISLDAKPFSIKLTPTVVEATDVQDKKVAKVGTEPGLVVVEVLDVMPENTCFFFTH